MPRIQQVIDTLEAECAELRERLAWLEAQLTEFQARQQEAAGEVPARSLRRATTKTLLTPSPCAGISKESARSSTPSSV